MNSYYPEDKDGLAETDQASDTTSIHIHPSHFAARFGQEHPIGSLGIRTPMSAQSQPIIGIPPIGHRFHSITDDHEFEGGMLDTYSTSVNATTGDELFHDFGGFWGEAEPSAFLY
jgi:hypothetical protein